MSATASGDASSCELGDRGLEPGVRLLVTAEQAFDAGAGDRQPNPQRGRVGGDDAHALEQGRVALGEPAGGGERAAERASSSSTRSPRARPRGGSAARASNQRAALAGARCAAASPASRSVADRGPIALARGELDVVGAGRRGRASPEQALGAPLVRAEPPAAGRRLVDRSADERVPEAKAPRHVRVAHEVEPRAARRARRASPARPRPRRPRRAPDRTGRRPRPHLRARGALPRTAARAPRRARRQPRAGRARRPATRSPARQP